MDKIALLFPGQGSQYVGMVRDLTNKYTEAKRILQLADDVLGYKISDIMLNGPEEKLRCTINTQPAVLTASTICWELLKSRWITPDYAAGHSLGEYSALVASECLEFTDALKLVSKRGSLMEEAVPCGEGAMAAVLGLSFEKVEEVCLNIEGLVEPANYNCPGQVVIAGEKTKVEAASAIFMEAGAKKVVLLNVGGPFHSSLMKSAADKFALELDKMHFNIPKFPIVSNLTADLEFSTDEIRNNLKKQIYNPVLWDMSMRRLINKGVTLFIEVGPSKVLSCLMKKIDKDVKVINVEDTETLLSTLNRLKEVTVC